MVVCGVLLQLFFKVATAELFTEQWKLDISQGNGVLGNRQYLIFIRTDIHHIALVTEVVQRVQLQKLLPETPSIAAAVYIARLALYQFQEINELLNGSRVGQMLFHQLCGYIGKVCAFHIGEQIFLIAVQITDKVGQTQGKGIPLVGRGQITLCVNKSLPLHLLLAVNLILRSFRLFQIVGVMFLFFWIEIAVILYQLTQAFFYLRPTKS